MKKIFTTLMAAMVAVVGFAIPVKELGQIDKAKVDLSQLNVFKTSQNTNVSTCSSTDENGDTWQAYFQVWGEAGKVFRDQYTIEELPAYLVLAGMYKASATSIEEYVDYSYGILWPAYAAEFMKWENDELVFDIEAAKEKYPDTWDKPVSFKDLYNVYSANEYLTEYLDGESVVFPQIANGFGYFGVGLIQTSYWLGLASNYQGDEEYYTLNGTTLSISNYDPDTYSCDLQFTGSIGKITVLNSTNPGSDEEYVSASSVKKFDISYSGEIGLLGFEQLTYDISDKIHDVHIFNSGISNYDSDWGQVYYYDYEDVTRYWVVFTDQNWAYSMPDTEGATPANECFSESVLPTEPRGYLTEEAPAEKTYWNGALFAAADSEKPYGLWELKQPWEIDEYDYLVNVPTEGELFAGRYNLDASTQDGTFYLYGMFFRIPDASIAGGTKIGIGDKEKGFNVVMNDVNGDIWSFSYKGDIYFHNNPENYLEVETIPAVSDGTYDAGDVTGVESVVAEEKLAVKVVGNSIVAPEGAEVYNLNGMRVKADNLSNGIYIVKAGNNAAKVLVK